MKWEIVVNDDGSAPPLADALQAFKGRVRFEHNSVRQGWPENWNVTLRKARGTWVHMLHCDDLVEPEFAPTMWNLIKAYPEAAYLHSELCVQRDAQPMAARFCQWLRARGRSEQTDPQPKVFRKGEEAARHALTQGIRIPTIVVRREIACSIPGMRAELLSPADEEYVVRLAQEGDVVFVPRSLCRYLRHRGQYSLKSWLDRSFLQEYLRVQEEALKAMGPQATVADQEAAYRRVANAACTVALARAFAGHKQDAAEALDEAIRLSPAIQNARSFRRTKQIVNNALLRYVYRWLS